VKKGNAWKIDRSPDYPYVSTDSRRPSYKKPLQIRMNKRNPKWSRVAS